VKKLLVAAVAVALILWVISWFRTPDAVVKSAAKPWPGKLGTLESAGARVTPLQSNPAALKLLALAKALPKSEAVDDFVAREIARGTLTIGQPPALADVAAIRELLLREPIVWERRGGIGGDDDTQSRRAAQMTTARALVAAALAKARAKDAAAWDDLHAVWKLARSLDGHPQVMVQTAAFSMVRMINGVAWKMPLPAPAWLAEVQEHDVVAPLLDAYQHQTASYADDGLRLFPTKMLADSVDHDRAIAESLVRETRCDVKAPSNELGVDLTNVWRRAFRYRAEREATANALRVREGQAIEPKSRCSDGTWSFDGTTLRFTREIATAAPDRPMPLALRIAEF
jgi:hypothetical protein